MKKLLYTFLMIVLMNMIAFGVYLASLVILIRHGFIERRDILCFTDMTMSPYAYAIVALIAILIGYRMAEKWWQIIYVDGVYYFDRSKIPATVSMSEAPLVRRKKVVKKTEKV